MARKLFNPVYGEIYQNRGGGYYRCITPPYLKFDYPDGEARMMNVQTGWTIRVAGIVQYEDGTIEWDYSHGGYFTEMKEEFNDECRRDGNSDGE